jgi:hypothetical protein
LFRLIPVAVFVLVMSAPGMAWLIDKAKGRLLWRAVFSLLLAATLIQAVFFQWKFHASANTTKRLKQFDADYVPVIFQPAIASSSNPIYLADFDFPGYINAYWYGTLQGIHLSRFVRLSPTEPFPEGAVVISTEKPCPRCKIIAAREPYAVFSIIGPARVPSPLVKEGFKAELQLLDGLPRVQAGKPTTFQVRIKNASEVVWPSPERVGGSYQVSLGNHWLNSQGQMLKQDDGRTTLHEDLAPGATTELTLTVNAPAEPGDYILEIDMLQEGVVWFGLTGSPTLKLPLKVE